MKKGKKKIQISTSIFVVASIANLIILAIFFYFSRNLIFEDNVSENNLICDSNGLYDTSDPFITKSPNFKKILNGPGRGILDPSIGGDMSSVVITMYSDIGCNYCYEQEKNIRQIINDYSGELKFILKDYPELKSESLSWQAAMAGRCAEAQDAFWDYHDLMYKNVESLNRDKFIEIAKSLNLNIGTFNNCMNSEEQIDLVIANVVEARALNIKGLPTIYINDREVSSKINKEELVRKIDIEISSMEALNKEYE